MTIGMRPVSSAVRPVEKFDRIGVIIVSLGTGVNGKQEKPSPLLPGSPADRRQKMDLAVLADWFAQAFLSSRAIYDHGDIRAQTSVFDQAVLHARVTALQPGDHFPDRSARYFHLSYTPGQVTH